MASGSKRVKAERQREVEWVHVKEERRRQAILREPGGRQAGRQAAPFAKHSLSLVRGEGGEPRRPQHDRRPHWSTRLPWVGLRKNWRGEKSPLNSCGYRCEKLDSAQPASSARRFRLTYFANTRNEGAIETETQTRETRGASSPKARGGREIICAYCYFCS